MKEIIRAQLMALVDEKYKAFHSSLVPGIDHILGVRLPEQKKIAKEIAKGDWRTYLEHNLPIKNPQDKKSPVMEEEYYEEIMIQGLVIGYAKADYQEVLQYVTAFVPKINNWGICDSFCSNLKFTNKNRSEIWSFLQPYFNSDKEFELRFAVIMALDYYILESHIDGVLETLDKVKHSGYYVKMAIAWALSVCFVKFPEKTMVYLKNNTLDDFTYNKALQKITESLRVDKEMKELIRSMKRKKEKDNYL